MRVDEELKGAMGVSARRFLRDIHRIVGLREPQGVAYELSADMLYVANAGDGSVRTFRGSDYTENGRIELGDDADNIRIDPAGQRVLVGYGDGAIAAIDLLQRRKITAVRLTEGTISA